MNMKLHLDISSWSYLHAQKNFNRACKCVQECRPCNKYAPSQPMMPATEAVVPESPFQAIASDYCDFGGSHYLITVDRFSNWPTVSYVKQGAPSSGSKGLGAFGIPEEISSDGGPEYISDMFKDFTKK